MPIKIQVKMEEKYMVDFMLRHNYSGFSGIMTIVAGLLCAAVSVQGFMKGNIQNGAVWAMCAILFLVINPNTIKSKAKAQVKNSEAFRKAFEYEFTREGIWVRQDEAENFVAWENIAKAVSTKQSVILYLNRVRAWILPKECMGEQYAEIVKMIQEQMPQKKVKIRGI